MNKNVRKYISHTTDRPGSISDLCANFDIDQDLVVGVAAALLASSISSFPTVQTQDISSEPTI